jgi:hypothetical protein
VRKAPIIACVPIRCIWFSILVVRLVRLVGHINKGVVESLFVSRCRMEMEKGRVG